MKAMHLILFIAGMLAVATISGYFISKTAVVPQNSYLQIPDFESLSVSQSSQEVEEAVLSFVSGTEYIPGQQGQVIVEARYRDGSSAIEVLEETLFVESTQEVLYDDASTDSTVDEILRGSVTDEFVAYPSIIWESNVTNTASNFNRVDVDVSYSGYKGEILYFFDSPSLTAAIDSSGNGNDGTLHNGAVIENGVLNFSGTDEKYLRSSEPIFNGEISDITISFDLELDTGSGFGYLVCSSESTAECGIILNVGQERISILLGERYKNFDLIGTGFDFFENNKYIIEYDESMNEIYLEINGQNYTNFVASGTGTKSFENYTDGFDIGLRWSSTSANTALQDGSGWMDNFALFRELLTEQEKQAIRNESFIQKQDPADVELIFTCDADTVSPAYSNNVAFGSQIFCPVSGDAFQYNFTLGENESSYDVEIDINLTQANDVKWTNVGTVTYNGGPNSGPYLFHSSTKSASIGLCTHDIYGFSGYTCGEHKPRDSQTGYPSAMMRDLTNYSSSEQILGVSGNFALSKRERDGGSLGSTYGAIVLTDFEKDTWRFAGSQRGSKNSITFDLVNGGVYERINNTQTFLGTAGGGFSNPRNSIGTIEYVEMWVQNGSVHIKRDGVKVFEEETSYGISNETTYGLYGHDDRGLTTGDVLSTVIHASSINDITNSTQISYEDVVNCDAYVQYPDKTYYINGSEMFLNTNGNAYTTFNVPNIEGVYEYQTTCNIQGNNQIASKSFHVTDPGISAVVIK